MIKINFTSENFVIVPYIWRHHYLFVLRVSKGLNPALLVTKISAIILHMNFIATMMSMSAYQIIKQHLLYIAI